MVEQLELGLRRSWVDNVHQDSQMGIVEKKRFVEGSRAKISNFDKNFP